jgi:tetratricopeptide (TPR) repeat protein
VTPSSPQPSSCTQTSSRCPPRTTFFYRDPDRSLELVRKALTNQREPRRHDAYHVWGLILRDQLDTDGAIEQLEHALAATRDAKQRAQIHIDMGYVAAKAQRWSDAVGYFDDAARDRAQVEEISWTRPSTWLRGRRPAPWVLPLLRKADVLGESGCLDDALAQYEEVRLLDDFSPDPWIGIGRIQAAEGRVGNALAAYEFARRRAASPAVRASVMRAVGDALAGRGCPEAGARCYEEALKIDPSYAIERQQPLTGRTCPYGPVGSDGFDPACSVTALIAPHG